MPSLRRLPWLAAAVLFSPAAHSAPYLVTDLGPLPGDTATRAAGLNVKGQVAGLSSSGYLNPSHGVIWNNGVPTSLGDLGREPDVAAINDLGQVVGTRDVNGEFVWYSAFVWDKTMGLTSLGTLPGGHRSFAHAVNQNGVIVGAADDAATGQDHAFVWSKAQGFTELPTFGGQISCARGINAAGQVVGDASTPDQSGHAFVWTAATGLLDLGLEAGDYYSQATAINTGGQIAGVSGSGQWSHAVLWNSAHELVDLGTLGGTFNAANGINDAGQVVGESLLAGNIGPSHAFLWDSAHGMQDLNGLIDPAAGWTLNTARAINAKGQIAGTGTINGATHAFLLSPAPPLALTVDSKTVLSGQSEAVTVTLNAPATVSPNPFGTGELEPGAFIRLTASSSAITLSGQNVWPAQDNNLYLYIPQGQTQGTVTVTGGLVTTQTSAKVTATLGKNTATAALVVAPIQVASLTIAPASVIDGDTSTATITLNAPAFQETDPVSHQVYGGALVRLLSPGPAVTFGQGAFRLDDGNFYAYVPQGQTQATVTLVTGPVSGRTRAPITASLNGSARSAVLTIQPVAAASLTLSPSSVISGGGTTATVTLSAPAFELTDPVTGQVNPGILVKLTASAPGVTFGNGAFLYQDGNTYVYIPQGQTQATFSVNTGLFTAKTGVQISAFAGGVTRSATLTVNPVLVSQVTLSPKAISSGGSTTVGVILNAPAGTSVDPTNGQTVSGVLIRLTADSPAVTFGNGTFVLSDGNTYAYIPQGGTQTTFMANAGVVTTATSVTLGASLNNAAKTAILKVTP